MDIGNGGLLTDKARPYFTDATAVNLSLPGSLYNLLARSREDSCVYIVLGPGPEYFGATNMAGTPETNFHRGSRITSGAQFIATVARDHVEFQQACGSLYVHILYVRVSTADQMENRMIINGFVLAGGKSSRMRQNKALMRLGETPLVLRAAEILQPFVQDVILLGQPDLYGKLWPSVVADRWPNQGPLAAVCTGLLYSKAEWNIFLACDLPLTSPRFLELLVLRVMAARSDAVVPCTGEGWQPLSAAYHARCSPVFARAIEEGRHSMVGVLPEIKVDIITHEEIVRAGLSPAEFANVNTPEDWERIKTLSTERDTLC